MKLKWAFENLCTFYSHKWTLKPIEIWSMNDWRRWCQLIHLNLDNRRQQYSVEQSLWRCRTTCYMDWIKLKIVPTSNVLYCSFEMKLNLWCFALNVLFVSWHFWDLAISWKSWYSTHMIVHQTKILSFWFKDMLAYFILEFD